MNIGESFKWSSPYVVFREDFFRMWSYKTVILKNVPLNLGGNNQHGFLLI